MSDEIVVLGEGTSQSIKDDGNETTTITKGQRFYIKATATLYDIENKAIEIGAEQSCISNTAYAREEESKKGMDGSQITGTASSYARKYALNGLFNIDDTKDADTDEFKKQQIKDEDEQIGEKLIDKMKLDLLNQAIEKNHIKNEAVEIVLANYGYTNTSQIKMKDYMKIVNDFKTKKEE